MLTPQELLDRLDARHDELIQKLDDLNAQIEAALTQFAKARSDGAASVDEVLPAVRQRAMRRAA